MCRLGSPLCWGPPRIGGEENLSRPSLRGHGWAGGGPLSCGRKWGASEGRRPRMSGGGGLKLPAPGPEPPEELSPCQWGDILSLPLPAGENKTIVSQWEVQVKTLLLVQHWNVSLKIKLQLEISRIGLLSYQSIKKHLFPNWIGHYGNKDTNCWYDLRGEWLIQGVAFSYPACKCFTTPWWSRANVHRMAVWKEVESPIQSKGGSQRACWLLP